MSDSTIGAVSSAVGYTDWELPSLASVGDRTGDGPVDAVFVIGTGSEHYNEELLYALRNVERNCPFVRRVYIVGECPPWADPTTVTHLWWPDRFSHAKDANIIDKLRHACEEPGISKRILFCSDDQFQTKVCSWEDFSPVWLRQYSQDDNWYASRGRIWHTRLRKTLERERLRRLSIGAPTDTIFYWEPHIYSPIDRDLFIEYAKWSDYEHRDDTITQSGYYNYIFQPGARSADHTFITDRSSLSRLRRHVAYSDRTFGTAMGYLRATFGARSRFERPGTASIDVTLL